MDTKKKHSRKNPIETANFLSLLFFGWIAPIIWKGARRDLHLTDLYDTLKSDESERLGDRLEREWNKELEKSKQATIPGKDGIQNPKKQPSLMFAIARMFWAPFIIHGFLLFVQSAILQVMEPILQGWIISYFEKGENVVTKNEVLIYAAYLVIINTSTMTINNHCNLRQQQIGMCVRVACCSMIYRKILRLDQSAVKNAAAGQVANLISNDVARFDEVFINLHYLWIVPIQTLLIAYIMWKSVGVAALVGIGLMIMQTIPVQGCLSSISTKLREKIASKTDERVELMGELLSGIEVVKMYAWEKPFELMVSKVRALEMKSIRYMSHLRGFKIGFAMLPQRISLYFTFVCFVLMGKSHSAEMIFVIVGLFNVLLTTSSVSLPAAIISAGETSVSLERITAFLLLDEVERSKIVKSSDKNSLHDVQTMKIDQQIKHRVAVEMDKVTANWIYDQLPTTLREVSIKIRTQSLCALVGPVGSGKSSLLHLVLGELPVQSGRLSLFTDGVIKTGITTRDICISYASQDPWLFSATIRDNILFGQPYDKIRYQEVTRVCALLEDFEQLPQGDLSFVGERGAALSGGQKARVNLARAVYRDADLYLLDDPLSAVDPRVSRHLFEECITGFLKDKTRILVTHQLQYLRQADTVVVLNRGTVECQGTYDELVKGNSNILDSSTLEEPNQVTNSEKNREKTLEGKTTAMTADDKNHLSKVKAISKELEDMGEEEITIGNIPKKVYRDYFLSGGNIYSLAFLTVVFIAGQIAASGTDYWVTYWTSQEALRATSRANTSITDITSYRNDTKTDHQSLWIDEHGLLRPSLGIYGYTICLISCILFITLRSILFMEMSTNASRNLHNSILANVLRATMRFINTNPSGRIMNRFCKDIGTMDELLPIQMLEALQVVSIMSGILALVVLANNWMILPAVAICGFYCILRSYYLKIAQGIKRLEGITKSPMFSHASSTIDGLTTIRSRGALAERLLRKEFDRHQDAHTGAWYLTIATSAAFGMMVDLISCSFIACICFAFILIDDGNTTGEWVGLAISQSLVLLDALQYGMRQSTEVISQMTSVERILQYTNLPKEGPFTTENPPSPAWPLEGGLILKDVSMRYGAEELPVLKGLNVNIKPGWKVGIVGRTGAGKSSLISALFRLTGDGLEGEILLDGIDTKSIGLHELRPRISIIPQEPILFSASLRQNLDPFEQYSDPELWSSLREVELGNVVASLDVQVAVGGSNFSIGQRQLICLARAILRNNRILVLDEATANVDHSTDALVQKTIKRRFADCTVLTIAHRLNTIMDSDRVLVMQDGCIVEFDHPYLLLKNRDGHFSQMLQQTGRTAAAKLAGIAESSFLLNLENQK